jgi:hypothetical protein
MTEVWAQSLTFGTEASFIHFAGIAAKLFRPCDLLAI